MHHFMTAAIQIDGTYKILAIVGAILLVAAPRLKPLLAKFSRGSVSPLSPTPIEPYLLDSEWLAAYQHLMSDAMRAGCADSVSLLNDLMECRTTRGLEDEKGGS